MMNDEKINELLKNPTQSAYLLKSSLKLFIKVFHYYMHRKQFVFKPFHLKIIDKLENIIFGKNEKPNLYIGLAPRYGKSQAIIYVVAYGFALNPKSNFIHTSYGADLVARFSSEIKKIIESDLFKALFKINISSETSAKDLWKIVDGGEFRATSLGGVITGFGAGITEDGWGGALLIDDFMKAGDYRSQLVKENVIDVYKNTLKSRRNNPRTPIIIIAQRLAKDDLIGWLMENEADDWDFFILPTLNEYTGDVLWPEKHTAEELLKMKSENPFLFYSQYQQEPIVLGGEVIKTEWFRFYPLSVKYKYDRVFITADTAQKVKEHNDFSVFSVWGTTDLGHLHLLDMSRGKWEAPALKSQALSIWNKWVSFDACPCSAMYIEDKVSGTGLIQEIQASCGIPILPLKPDKDKLERVEASLTYLESGLVYLPENKNYNFNADFLSECESFTRDDSHKHDDMVDTFTYAVQIGLSRRTVSILDVLD